MSDKIGLVTGSFDPVTLGHIDVIERASQLFDKLYVAVLGNVKKDGLYTLADRKIMLEEALPHLSNVDVLLGEGILAVDLAKQLGVTHLVRGLRNAQDLVYEAELSFYNTYLAQELETVFFLTKPAYQHISSSRVRELLAFGGDISPFVPVSVLEKENARAKQQAEKE